MAKENTIIIKFDFYSEQTVGEITKIVGLTPAKFLVPMIDCLNLEANPRSSATGAVTTAIQESIETNPSVFPFKTKGILLASSQYVRLERSRISISPENPKIEGILDGGHNTLAIGLYILNKALSFSNLPIVKGSKTWDEFKEIWEEKRNIIGEYLETVLKDPTNKDLNFFVPVELLVPRDVNDFNSVEFFKNDLLEICEARNNNVQLPVSARSNQKGYYEALKKFVHERNAFIGDRIEWKPNEGGDIKVQDIIALTWIPLTLTSAVKDTNGKIIEPVTASNLYSSKGICVKQFEKFMDSPDVTIETSADYKRELKNLEVCSAFKIAADLPELYDYIYEMFPKFYNTAGGSYGRITAVKALNEKRKEKRTPFSNKEIETLSPDGFIVPLVYGLQALMETKEVNGYKEIVWKQSPMPFLHDNLEKIVKNYSGIFSMCDYDPQKIGKSAQSYAQAISSFKMAMVGIL